MSKVRLTCKMKELETFRDVKLTGEVGDWWHPLESRPDWRWHESRRVSRDRRRCVDGTLALALALPLLMGLRHGGPRHGLGRRRLYGRLLRDVDPLVVAGP